MLFKIIEYNKDYQERILKDFNNEIKKYYPECITWIQDKVFKDNIVRNGRYILLAINNEKELLGYIILKRYKICTIHVFEKYKHNNIAYILMNKGFDLLKTKN